jgi:type IV pilus assembly protein PilQ
MMTDRKTKRSIFGPLWVAVTIAAAVAACASQNTSQIQPAAAGKQIVDILTSEDAANMVVTVKGSEPLTYTAIKQDFPLGVLFDFPDTALDHLREAYYPPENDTVSTIRASELNDNGRASRIFIALKRDAPYELSPDGKDLKIVFAKSAAPNAAAKPVAIKEGDTDASAPAPAAAQDFKPATTLKTVSAVPSKQSTVVTIEANGAVQDYNAFTITETPPRIVFDLKGLKSPFTSEERTSLQNGPVSRIRHFAYPDKVRLVIETQKPYLADYTAEPSESGLVIKIGQASKPAAAPAAAKEMILASGPAPAPAPKNPGAPAWINRVEFTPGDAGKSTVIIGTTRPVEYEISKAGEKMVQLRLSDTQVPEKQKRPLISTRFESAVDRVTPGQDKKAAVVAIQLRESVPYTAEQDDGVIRINFAASTIPPKPYENASPPAWKSDAGQVSAQLSPAAAAVSAAAPQAAVKKVSSAAAYSSEDKTYRGEKIALDFYDTDIKNVFRILQEISGKNFAIDKGVTGKVTLALQRPVPWDQVLDLVLKMNQLGMSQEGDIIRIASLSTLQQEEKLRQAQLKAEQDSKKQEEEGEPLVTEYFPVNYSNAKTEILPHLTNILTPNRGKVSVDERNNQVIFTDIAEKVKQARMIVAKIDQVTPQVIIEARVIEANSNFTREIGFDWGTISLGAFKIGGDIEFGPTTFQANNIPTTFSANNLIGFNFATLTGTPFSIVDAKLTASEIEGKTNIISSPKIVTLDNKKAVIKQGLEVPYLERDSSGNATVRFKDVDLLLEVTPNVSPDKRIVMNIFITKNDVVDPTATEPALSTNEAKTEILVEDGDTIVIGGILKDTKKLSEQGIPGLRKLPVLGWLFSSERKENTKNELLIFITPRIVQLEQRKVI